jgi:hypothetical protein
VGGRSLAFYPNRFVSSKVHHHQREQEPLVGGVEKRSLISGVEENRSTLRSGNVNMKREDSIVSPTLSPYTSMDLGARSLVSGVDCNDPEKSPIRIDCYFLFGVILTSCILHLARFLKPYIILWYNPIFIFARTVLYQPSFFLLI